MISANWVGGIVVVAVIGLYLRGLVGRLDRLHLRVEASLEALDVQLLRRVSLVNEVAISGDLDPASSVLLADAAAAAGGADTANREFAESTLSASLRAVLEQPDLVTALSEADEGQAFLHRLADSCDRVVLARRFANEAVRSTRAVRRLVLVRALHLAGHAPLPDTFEMDDAPAAALAQFSHTQP